MLGGGYGWWAEGNCGRRAKEMGAEETCAGGLVEVLRMESKWQRHIDIDTDISKPYRRRRRIKKGEEFDVGTREKKEVDDYVVRTEALGYMIGSGESTCRS